VEKANVSLQGVFARYLQALVRLYHFFFSQVIHRNERKELIPMAQFAWFGQMFWFIKRAFSYRES
jgi:hypothetical protein